jgi:hypothetical protein
MRRSSVMFLSRAALLALVFVGSACDNGPDNPVLPTPDPITETFTGTITLNGSVTHPFTTAVVGRTTATISAINPAGSFIGFQLGTWSGAVCTAVLSNDAGTQDSTLTAVTQSTLTPLCVRIHDPNGTLTDKTVTYTVTVEHP